MAFAITDLTDFNDTTRTHCAGARADEVPDSVITQSYYQGWVEATVNTLQPTYDTLTAAQKLEMQWAATELMASRICRFYCQNRFSQATNNKSSFVRSRIDWLKIAKRLQRDAYLTLDPPTTADGSRAGIILADSSYSEITGATQIRIRPDGNATVD